MMRTRNDEEMPFSSVSDKKGIVNLTQHRITYDQEDAGVEELLASDQKEVESLLTFDEIPSQREMERRAFKLTAFAIMYGYSRAMIGGAPFFMSTLERELLRGGIIPLYAFSIRVSEEKQEGTVIRKTNVFKHLGFVEGVLK